MKADTDTRDYVDGEEIPQTGGSESQSLQTVSTPLAMQVQTEMSPDDLRAEIAKQTEMRSILVDYVKSQMKAEHHYYSFNAGDKPVLTQDGAYLINGLFKAIPGPVKTTNSLTNAQQRFVDLDREYTAIIKPFFEQYRAAKEAVIEESGTNAFFQDDQGVVYHTTEKKGQWVDFFPFDIHRTRRGDEKQGSLSLTMAREAGFVVEGK